MSAQVVVEGEGAATKPTIKVGSIVKYTSGHHGVSYNNPLWGSRFQCLGVCDSIFNSIGVVGARDLRGDLRVGVRWFGPNTGIRNHNMYYKSDLELATREEIKAEALRKLS